MQADSRRAARRNEGTQTRRARAVLIFPPFKSRALPQRAAVAAPLQNDAGEGEEIEKSSTFSPAMTARKMASRTGAPLI